jgi:hypothetical protein
MHLKDNETIELFEDPESFTGYSIRHNSSESDSGRVVSGETRGEIPASVFEVYLWEELRKSGKALEETRARLNRAQAIIRKLKTERESEKQCPSTKL